MGKKAPWMPFYGFDFFTDGLVRRMTRETRMIYLELLWHAWNEDGIPSDLEECASVVDMPPRQFAKHWAKIAPAWQEKDGETLVNKRMQAELDAKQAVLEAKREAGRKGAAARWLPSETRSTEVAS